MYNKEQTKVLFILINSIIDATVIQLLVYHGNQLATIRQPKINHYTTYQDFNNKNEVMYPIWNQSVSNMEPLCIQHY